MTIDRPIHLRRYYGRFAWRCPVGLFRDGLGGGVLSFGVGFVARRPMSGPSVSGREMATRVPAEQEDNRRGAEAHGAPAYTGSDAQSDNRAEGLGDNRSGEPE